jgi:hypothetical protein
MPSSAALRLFAAFTASLMGLLLVAHVAANDQVQQPRPDRTALALQALLPAEKARADFHTASGYRGFGRILDTGQSIKLAGEEGSEPGKTGRELIAQLACASDAVFEGTVELGQTHPTGDGTFLFTDYYVRVTRVVRSTAIKARMIGYVEVVTRPGGHVEVSGKSVTATVTTFPPLQVGLSYLFFGTWHPTEQAFVVPRTFGVMRNHPSSFTPVRALPTRHVEPDTLSRSQMLQRLGALKCHD